MNIIHNIKKYLQDVSATNEVLYFYPNPGNGGDNIIAYATYQLLDDLNINYQLFNERTDDPVNKILIYGGGGNLTKLYSQASDFVKKYHFKTKKLIILPHTIVGNEDLLQSLGSNVDIFAREETSYNHIVNFNTKSNVYLSHDLAFNLDITRLLNQKHIIRQFINCSGIPIKTKISTIYENLKSIVKQQIDLTKTLNCFRTDREKTIIPFPEYNMDLSLMFNYGTNSKKKSLLNTYVLSSFINRYKIINTNRLHICILSALLGKIVNFYPNNYYKCKAVYDFSIKGKFPNVSWVDNNISVL